MEIWQATCVKDEGWCFCWWYCCPQYPTQKRREVFFRLYQFTPYPQTLSLNRIRGGRVWREVWSPGLNGGGERLNYKPKAISDIDRERYVWLDSEINPECLRERVGKIEGYICVPNVFRGSFCKNIVFLYPDSQGSQHNELRFNCYPRSPCIY